MQSVWKTKAPNTSSLLFDRYLQIQQYHDNRRWRSQVMVESSGTDDQWTRRLFKQFILSHTFFYHNNSLIRLSVKTVPNKLPILSGYKPPWWTVFQTHYLAQSWLLWFQTEWKLTDTPCLTPLSIFVLVCSYFLSFSHQVTVWRISDGLLNQWHHHHRTQCDETEQLCSKCPRH